MRTFVKLQALLVAPICFLLATVSVAPAQPANPNSGARLVKDISPGAGSSTPDSLTRVGDTLFFRAIGRQLWKSDGTEAGTVMLKDFPPGPSGFTLLLLTRVGGTLFFRAEARDPVTGADLGQELWKSDGTPEGTVLVKDINPGAGGSFANWLTDVNGTLFFRAASPDTGDELWKSDGTPEGTVLVKDINPGPRGSGIEQLVNVNGTLFFHANHPDTGQELWKSDGTAEGTVLVKDIYPGPQVPGSIEGSSFPQALINVNGTLFFTAVHPDTGRELWKSDGTPEGTVLVKDINPGTASAFFSTPFLASGGPLLNVNGTVFFKARHPDTGFELWKSDGTEAGTVLVKDMIPGQGSPTGASIFPGWGISFKDRLLFGADDGVSGRELWSSDGTDAGTVQVEDINPGSASGVPSGSSFFEVLQRVAGLVVFPANDGIHGEELWASDGISATMIQEIAPGAGSSSPRNFTVVGSQVFFVADDNEHGRELWVIPRAAVLRAFNLADTEVATDTEDDSSPSQAIADDSSSGTEPQSGEEQSAEAAMSS